MSTYYWEDRQDWGTFEADNTQDALSIAPPSTLFLAKLSEVGEEIILDER